LAAWRGFLLKGQAHKGAQMPTKTKPKKRRQSTSKITPAKLTTVLEENLTDCLGWNRKMMDKGLPCLVHLLSYARDRYASAISSPQPAHLVAEFEPIHKTARALSSLIEQRKLTHAAELMLPPVLTRLRDDLNELVAGTAATIAFYKKGRRSSGGAVRSYRKEILEAELTNCAQFFREHAADENRRDRSDLAEFLDICKKTITG
jgi:hypothetical protein